MSQREHDGGDGQAAAAPEGAAGRATPAPAEHAPTSAAATTSSTGEGAGAATGVANGTATTPPPTPPTTHVGGPSPTKEPSRDGVGTALWLVPALTVLALAIAGQVGGTRTSVIGVSLLTTVAAAILARHGLAGARLQPAPAAGAAALAIGLVALGVATYRADLLGDRPFTQAKSNPPGTFTADVLDAHGQHLDQRTVDGHSLRGAQLAGADLSGLDLTKADLRGADLRGSNLRRTNLAGIQADGVNLRGADLSRACLDHTDLRGADLTGVDAESADTTDVQLDPGAEKTASAWPKTPDRTSCQR